MKNIFKFFGALLTLVFTVSLTGCVEEQLESADVGLHIKVFFPTKVMEGQPMTINGSGFSDATEIVFPGDVRVTDFEIVSNDMIRVNAPSGIAAEGGHILVRTADDEVESPLPLTLGKTVITGCAMPEEGVAIEGGSQFTIYGSDLEFISKIEMMDEDGNPVFIEAGTFIRKSSETIIFTVPRKVYEGEVEIKLYTVDGKEVNNEKLPVLTYKPASDGGHWETVEHILWENPDPAGLGAVSWSGQYRFGLEGKDGNNECVATFPADQWEIIKNGTFCLTYEAPAGSAYQIRATTGWWSFDGDGVYDIHENDERVVDNGDGTYTLVYTLSEEPLKSGIYDLIDEQHLLFTGSGGFTPLKIFYTEEVWVGGTIEIVRTSIWKNDGSVAAATWSGSPYRFAPETNSTGEEVYAVPTDLWEKMKTTPFMVDFATTGDWFQIRILDGWWSVGNNDANDITPNFEGLVANEDGTFTIVVDLASKPDLVPVLDEKHLLFAGDGFQILELYWEEEVIVDDSEPKELVIWKNDGSLGEGTWGNTYRFALEGKNGGDASVDVPADLWELFKSGPFNLIVEPVADWWQIRVLTGWWNAQWPEKNLSDAGAEFDIKPDSELLSDNGDGTFTLTIDFTGHEILDLMDEQNLLFAGSGFQIQKIYCLQ